MISFAKPWRTSNSRKGILPVLLCAGILLAFCAQAAVLQYQARLTDPVTGAPRSGQLTMTFRLYEVDEGGAALWTETKDVTISNGLLNTLLGDTTTLPGGILDGRDLWLGIQVESDSEAVPRQRILPVAYALFAANAGKALTLDGLGASAFALANHTHQATDITSGWLEDVVIPEHIARIYDVMPYVLQEDGEDSLLDADFFDGLNSTDFWKLGGNSVESRAVIGTVSAYPITIMVNEQEVLQLEYHESTDSPNIIGGHGDVISGVYGATIAGGGRTVAENEVFDIFGAIGGGEKNKAGDNAGTVSDASFATVGGGSSNNAGAACATIAGGQSNLAEGQYTSLAGGKDNAASADYAAIGGGFFNQAGGQYVAIGGGDSNSAVGNAATVAGGASNDAGGEKAFVGGGYGHSAAGAWSTVCGGLSNTASNSYATVPGGINNLASGMTSFAAGNRAKATHNGSFVWGDNTAADVNSDRNNQVKFRASGGMVVTANASSYNPAGLKVESTGTAGVALFATQTSSDTTVLVQNKGTGRLFSAWSGASAENHVFHVENDGAVYGKSFNLTSDRNAKENFAPVDEQQILDRVAELPLATWNYKGDDSSERHLGPVAQDFRAAFGLGASDTSIATVDIDGVALAAIQGLQKRSKNLERENKMLREQLNDLAARLTALEQERGR